MIIRLKRYILKYFLSSCSHINTAKICLIKFGILTKEIKVILNNLIIRLFWLNHTYIIDILYCPYLLSLFLFFLIINKFNNLWFWFLII
jgi:hypothetical protein